MGWFDKAIRRGVEEAVAESIPRIAEEAVKRSFEPGGAAHGILSELCGWDLPDDAPMNERQFVLAMCYRFVAEGIKGEEAIKYARDTYAAFLADEKIKFGDPAYAWDRNGARAIAEECEIDYWERAA